MVLLMVQEVAEIFIVFILTGSTIAKVLDVSDVWHELFDVVQDCFDEDMDSDGIMLHTVADDANAD